MTLKLSIIVDSSYDLLKRGNNYTTYGPTISLMNLDTFSYDSRLISYHKRSFSSSPSSLIPLRAAKFAAALGLNSHMKGKVKFQSGWTE